MFSCESAAHINPQGKPSISSPSQFINMRRIYRHYQAQSLVAIPSCVGGFSGPTGQRPSSRRIKASHGWIADVR